MTYTAWLVVDPDGYRPYFWHTPPTALDFKEGRKIFQLAIPLPDPMPTQLIPVGVTELTAPKT